MSNKKIAQLLKKNIFELLLIILIFFIFFQEFKIFRNIYYLFNKSHDQRATDAYKKTFFSGFCNGSSHGYLIYIKNKYSKNFNKKIPKIINNFNGKKEYWVFNDVNAQINENQIILLNGNDIDLKEYKIIDEYKNNCFFIEKK